ncbi:nucleolar DEAD-box protein required for synthesis of 60S ribosomal subunit [Taiwanofungus camphoratus]|nr:nucleolar DEAD-box protein required for synthesis of 60S ribosomal subunit [Antrodia cinnamomea]KAI0936329.1 nucleolar DEAD-box protein required for synthesis of 60S ribosomal subunit [Antrodia cinnamomea]
MAPSDDFVMTIDSDGEDIPPRQNPQTLVADDAQLNPDLHFDLSGDPYIDLLDDHLDPSDLVKRGSKPEPISVDNIIARRRLQPTKSKRKRDTSLDEDEESDISMGDSYQERGHSINAEGDEFTGFASSGKEEDPLGTSEDYGPSDREEILSENEQDEEVAASSSGDDFETETQAEKERKAAFFAPDVISSEEHSSFLSMNLSRPIIKSITTLGFHTPTPIQAATIPVALLGKDVVGNAVTGSGKTAAFIIPMLERLMYRDRGKKAAATRCLILVPTRELGVQCFEVGAKLAAHTDIRFCLVVGGLSVKAQEATLRTRPDVIIATPGRLIDHLRNSPSFTLEALDILVLDEADRMLSDGFADELTEIIKSCPTSRQTMLFSATMTDSVDELVKMSLNKPVRLFVDPKRSTARGLIQEFVRVRAGKEAERSALLVALCKRTFKSGVIIFFRSKKLAHQMRIVFSLLDMKSDELHGDLSQEQRLKALQQFRDSAVDYLMATDLASRGLDIKGIETVINFDMPAQLAQYLHRVGRTARAGKKGRSVTLVGEADRKMLKTAIKHAAIKDSVRHRQVPPEVVAKWSSNLDDLKQEVSEILQEEKEEKQLRQAEMELKKGQNMIEHEAEIYSRPARTWFQSGKEKAKAEALSKQQYEIGIDSAKWRKEKKAAVDKPRRDKFAGLSRRAKRRRTAIEEDDAAGESVTIRAAVRSAKKAARPVKIGESERRSAYNGKKKERNKDKGKGKVTVRAGGAFDSDMGQKTVREGVRANKGDAIGGMGKRRGPK